MTISKNILAGSGAVDPYEIEQSLIFQKTHGHALIRTVTSASNQKTWTMSFWFKKADNSGFIMYATTGDSSNSYITIYQEKLYINDYRYSSGGTKWLMIPTRVFRDPSAWYHLVFAVDTTQAVASNRLKLYINGVQETSFTTATYPAQDYDGIINSTDYGGINYVGNGFFNINTTGYGWNGNMAEFHHVDGTALTPSSFGETNDDTGQWIPKEYKGSYGTNGFYQKYEKGEAADNPFLFEGDFTIEMFFKLTSMQVTGGYSYPCLLWLPPHTGRIADGNTGYKLQINNGASGYVIYMASNSPDNFQIEAGSGAGAVSLNTWYHMAIVRDGMGSNNMSMYMNGVRYGQITYTGPVGSLGNTARIGASGRNYGNFAGYINNVRIVKGTAVYSGASFTVPTSNLTAISGTSLLALQGSGITDRLPATAPTLAAYGGSDVPVIQSSISGTVGTYTGLFSAANHNNANGGGISFTVPGSIGKDSSGNNNDFVGAMVFNSDVVTDSPTNSFCTLNSLDSSLGLLLQGNTNTGASGSNSWKMARSTFELTTGKWYWEMRWTGTTVNSTNGYQMGLKTPTSTLTAAAQQAGSFAFQGVEIFSTNGSTNTVTISPGSTTTGQNDLIMFAYDADAGKMWIGVNGTWTSSGNPAAGSNNQWASIPTTGVSPFAGSYGSNISVDCNFGQKPYAYTPPSGFLALSTKNLPEPAITPSEHFNGVLYAGDNTTGRQITGAGFQPDLVWLKNRSVTNYHTLFDSVRGVTNYLFANEASAPQSNSSSVTAFTSDGITVNHNASFGNNNANSSHYVTWNWKAGGTAPVKTYVVKVVSDSGNKYRFDDFAASAQTVDLQEGGTYTFDQSDSSNSGHPFRLSSTNNGTHGGGSEYTTGVVTTGSPGSAGAKTVITVAASAPTLYYYCSVHSGMGGQANTNSLFGSSYFDGDIKSTVSANQESGFSIVKYTATNDGAATVPHGLGVAPEMVFYKWGSSAWYCWTTVIDGSNDRLVLDRNDAKSTVSSSYGSFSSSFIRGIDVAQGVLAYAFVSKPGFSKIGTYIGNGSASGPFVNCGFKPAFVMRKRATGGTADWFISGAKINPINSSASGTGLANIVLWANNPSVDESAGEIAYGIDLLSNGFRTTTSAAYLNSHDSIYLYMAFAEVPFKYANAR